MYFAVICTPVRVRICVPSNPEPDHLILAFISRLGSPEAFSPSWRQNRTTKCHQHLLLQDLLFLFFLFLVILEFRVKRRISSKNPGSYSCVYSLYHFHDFVFIREPKFQQFEVRDKRNILFCVIVERWHRPLTCLSYLAFKLRKNSW